MTKLHTNILQIATLQTPELQTALCPIVPRPQAEGEDSGSNILNEPNSGQLS
jgi:hypothetical protein